MGGESAMDIDVDMGEMESDLDPAMMSFQASAIIAVCAAVLIGNAFVCALNCFNTRIQGVHVKFVVASATMNIIAAVVCMPLMAASLIEAEWKFGYLLCKMSGSICFGSMILTMGFCILAGVTKLFTSRKTQSSKLRENFSVHKDLAIVSIVIIFVLASLIILWLLVDVTKLKQDPTGILCRYANSPNITGYRMFYVVYSILLTFADLVLVIPFQYM